MEKLTEREVAVLRLITLGYGNNQISKIIFISIHTVKAHISSIIRKLNAKNRTNAVYIAVKNNLLDE
ncbi:two component LuxR family transcriptional regulator [Fusobacterium sp. CAG:439]|mgnify:FL=1|nr:two component LuxR family transcriptional regulator [Fusobacterium sp. CAG:439]HIT91773.1 response regulator transcription factor [Candidatus Stercorousia faecigallinarum]